MPHNNITKVKFKIENDNDQKSSNTFIFYQICRFPVDKLYNVRKLTINDEFTIIKSRERNVTKGELKKFIKNSPQSKFTIYPTFNFDNVGPPDPEEILTAHSLILNGR